MRQPEAWPALAYGEWLPTRTMLHLVTQMLGKTRLALAPPQPNWLNACLLLDTAGFTTGAIPYRGSVLTVRVDLHDSSIIGEMNDGRRVTVQLGSDRSVADIWAAYMAALAELGVEVTLSEKPQEVADTTPFSRNTHDHTFHPEQARDFHRVLCAIDGAFEAFRSPFYGRSGIQFWWGSFTFCVLLFSGRRLPPPEGSGLIRRHDLDAEQLNAGFWPGDHGTPDPIFFAYLIPKPDGAETAPMQPASAGWSPSLGEWVLPYDDVRRSEDPSGALIEFLDGVYQVAVIGGGWDAEAHRYQAPTRIKPR